MVSKELSLKKRTLIILVYRQCLVYPFVRTAKNLRAFKPVFQFVSFSFAGYFTTIYGSSSRCPVDYSTIQHFPPSYGRQRFRSKVRVVRVLKTCLNPFPFSSFLALSLSKTSSTRSDFIQSPSARYIFHKCMLSSYICARPMRLTIPLPIPYT